MTFSTIISADRLTNFIEPISTLVDECKLHLNSHGLEVRAVDPANVGMIDTILDDTGFESYEADGGLIALNLNQFEDVIDMADSGDLVHLELNEQIRKLDIRFSEVDYTQALINPESVREEPDIPALDSSVSVTATGKQMDRGVTAADLVDDHVELRSDADGPAFIVDAEGDTDDVQVEFGRDDLIDARVPESVRSLFSLDYMKDIVGVMDASAEVRVQLDDEMPVKMSYEHSEGHASVTYFLSPRVASE